MTTTAIGGEVRIARRLPDGALSEVFTSGYELDVWRLEDGGLPRPVDSRWHASDRRVATALRLYCCFRDLLAEAAGAGVLGRREARDLRTSVRAALLQDV